MKTINPAVKRRAIEFTARFGFITRELFFEYLCDFAHTQKYRTWRFLIEQNWLIPHDSDRLSAYLSHKARQNFAPTAVPARSRFFIEHDSIAAGLVLELSRLKLVQRYWTEREMVRSAWEVYSILGSNHADKIPDLVLELIGSYGSLRVAVEIERTRKSKERYGLAALSYLGMKNVDLIIYGCRSKHAARQVITAFQGEVFKKSYKVPAIFSTEDFAAKRLSAAIEFQGQTFKLLEFLSRALKTDILPELAAESAYRERTAVRSGESQRKEAA